MRIALEKDGTAGSYSLGTVSVDRSAAERAFVADLGGMEVTLMRLMKEIPWPSATIVLVCYLFRVF